MFGFKLIVSLLINLVVTMQFSPLLVFIFFCTVISILANIFLFCKSHLHELMFTSVIFRPSFSSPYGGPYLLSRPLSIRHHKRRSVLQRSRPLPPFSVAIQDAVVSSSSMVLSAIRIPIQWGHAQLQRHYSLSTFNCHHQRDVKRHERKLKLRRLCPSLKYLRMFLIPFLFLLSAPTTTYAMPGTNHALIYGESNDTHRQTQLINTAINNAVAPLCASTAENNDSLTLSVKDEKHSYAHGAQPVIFIADTDSVSFAVDSGANRIILNDAKLFDHFVASSGRVCLADQSAFIRTTGCALTEQSLKSYLVPLPLSLPPPPKVA